MISLIMFVSCTTFEEDPMPGEIWCSMNDKTDTPFSECVDKYVVCQKIIDVKDGWIKYYYVREDTLEPYGSCKTETVSSLKRIMDKVL
jgi:hypothetical protein